jgi:hypothetical protein
VWLSRDSYLSDEGIESLDNIIDSFQDVIAVAPNLVEFRFTRNTGPYRKLLPILASCEDNDLIIPADDDIYYGRQWLEKLLLKHHTHPEIAVAARARKIERNVFGFIKGYIYWPLIQVEGKCDSDMLVTFGGGVVLKRSFFSPNLLESLKFIELAPTADDIWFSALLKESGTSVYVLPSAAAELFFIEHPLGLFSNFNVKAHKHAALYALATKVWRKFASYLGIASTGNDKAFKAVTHYFKNI